MFMKERVKELSVPTCIYLSNVFFSATCTSCSSKSEKNKNKQTCL